MQIIANFLNKKDTIKQGMTSLFWYAFYEDFSVLPCSSWWDLQLNNFHPLNVPPHGFFLCTSKMKYKQKLSKTRKCSQEVFIEIVIRTNKSRSLNDRCYILSTSVYMNFYFIIGLAQQKQWPGTLNVMSNWKIYSFTHHFQWCLINTHARGKDNVFLAFFFYKVLMSRYNQEVNLRNNCVKFEFGTVKHQNCQDHWVTKTSRTLAPDFRTSLFVVWLS